MQINRAFLRRLLEEKAGYDPGTPHGAEKLQKDIATATGESLSVNTLKRLTGVLPYEGEPRASTLEILARFVGLQSAKALETVLKGTSSDFNLPDNFIDVKRLPTGQMLILEWSPGRRVVLRHLEGEEYLVEEAENSKLRTGDKIKLGYVAEGYPLIAADVVRNGKSLGEYSAARDEGITRVSLADK